MLSRSVRFGFVAALTVTGALLPACEGCDQPPPGEGNAVIIARTPNGSAVDADGQSTVSIVLSALGADGQPDLSPITAEPDRGFIGAAGGELAEGALTETPNNQGVLELDYRCGANDIGDAQIAISNGNAQSNVKITCREPSGALIIAIDDSDCDNIQADGESFCAVSFTVVRDAPVDIPQDGTASVTVVGTSGAGGNLDFIGAESGSQATDALALPLEAGTGAASFVFFAGFDAEDVTVQVEFGGTTRDVVIGVDAFDDQSNLTLSGDNQVIGGEAATVTVTATGANGLPAASPHDTVDIVIAGEGATVTAGGAGPAAELDDVALDANGQVDVTITTPVVNDATQFTLTVAYNYLNDPEFVRIATFTVTAQEVGALILTAVANPTTIHSDIAAERSSNLRVTFKKDNAVVAGGTVTLSIAGGDATRIFFANPGSFAAGSSATQVVLDQTDFDATGVATVPVQVSAVANVAPGLARIAVTGTDGVEQEAAEVIITVEREPVLQSIVAVTPNPNVIGVRGGAIASSTEVKFILFDDQNEPMANVPVTFTTNDTADPGVSVNATDVSDQAGEVSTILSAGTIAGPVTVVVTAQPQSPDPNVQLAQLTVASPQINIVGGLANFLESFMTCTAAIENREGTDFECSAVLVDRFQNLLVDQPVQFRAEGSGSTPVATTNGTGTATATLVLDDADSASTASMGGWSFGPLPVQGEILNTDGCFDDTVTTPCNVLDLCEASPLHCPLKDFGCIAAANRAGDQLAAGLRNTDAGMVNYIADHRACGFPVSCLLGDQTFQGGVPAFDGDECPVALGCFDYSRETECPHDGLMTVTAAIRGEEAFVDGNGNGILDFNDVNQNGRMDLPDDTFKTRAERCVSGRCELGQNVCAVNADCTLAVPLDSFVDLPEPFLDKNNNCARDDLTNAPHYQFQPALKVKHSDLFSDVDGNGLFGFGDPNVELNGLYDPDTEIFQTAHILTVNTPLFTRGGACTPGTAGCEEQVTPDGVVGIDPAAIPTTLARGESFSVSFRWSDANGNCPSPGFAVTSNATFNGPITLVGDTGLPLDDLRCGFSSGTNPIVPQCQDLPALGAPVGVVTVVEDCGTSTDNELATVTWSIGDVADAIAFNVLCGG